MPTAHELDYARLFVTRYVSQKGLIGHEVRSTGTVPETEDANAVRDEAYLKIDRRDEANQSAHIRSRGFLETHGRFVL